MELPRELEDAVRRQVATGRYASASEVLTHAMQLLDEYDQSRDLRLRQLREKVQVGLDQVRRGECGELDFDQLKAQARRSHQAAHRESA